MLKVFLGISSSSLGKERAPRDGCRVTESRPSPGRVGAESRAVGRTMGVTGKPLPQPALCPAVWPQQGGLGRALSQLKLAYCQ